MAEKLISRREIFRGRAVDLFVDTIEKPSGLIAEREIVKHSDCIAAVPIDDQDNVLLVKQFRRPVDRILLEIPAGCLEEGEDPQQCVRRELQEEIGYLPGSITPLGGIYAAPGYCTEYLHLFLATDLKKSRLVAEDTDEIEVIAVPLSEIPALIESGQICDAKSVAGLLRVMLQRSH